MVASLTLREVVTAAMALSQRRFAVELSAGVFVSMRVLVLSPNASSDRLLVGLRSEGLVCDTTGDLDDLPSALALSGPYDVVVLDLVSLDAAAHRAVRALRRSGSVHPVLAICARLEPSQEEAG